MEPLRLEPVPAKEKQSCQLCGLCSRVIIGDREWRGKACGVGRPALPLCHKSSGLCRIVSLQLLCPSSCLSSWETGCNSHAASDCHAPFIAPPFLFAGGKPSQSCS
uniref:Uncharacterized protein n=1 Tax=Laticauda laticaudata TaxID=8630 RepID=A0A8C5SP73_LATLA